MSGITRSLPIDEYDAATNSSSPSAGNPFVTVSALPAPDGDGIYDGNGIVPSGTVATIADSLTFERIANGFAQIKISNSNAGGGARAELQLASDTSTTTIQCNSSGRPTNPGDLVVSHLGGNIVMNAATSNSDYHWKINAAVALAFHGLSGNLGIGTGVITPTARFQVRGAGTGLGKLVLFEDQTGAEKFALTDSGLLAVHNTVSISSGDIKTSSTTGGLVLKDRTLAGSQRIYLDNGNLFIETE